MAGRNSIGAVGRSGNVGACGGRERSGHVLLSVEEVVVSSDRRAALLTGGAICRGAGRLAASGGSRICNQSSNKKRSISPHTGQIRTRCCEFFSSSTALSPCEFFSGVALLCCYFANDE